MVLRDLDIKKHIQSGQLRVEPFTEECPPGCISYGLTSAGYDARLADEFLVFTNALNVTVDPKAMHSDVYVKYKGKTCIVPPNSFVLGRTLEYFRIPRNILGVCFGKSTYARCGIVIPMTPLEPEWEGYVTVEISNTTPCPATVYANEGIMQVVFQLLTADCIKSYADKKGVYQKQTGITIPRVKQ